MIKRFIIAFILLVLVCGGIVGFNIFRDQAIQQFFANMPQPAMTVSTQTVEPMRWTPGIETIGTVAASQGVELTVEATGVVREMNFSANQRVDQGQLLLQLDNDVQEADLEAARAQAALDQQVLERALTLRERGVGAEANVESAQAAASASRSQVAKLEAVLDQRQLTAPFAGTIGLPRVEPGQYITPGTVVATLQDLDRMRVDFTVPEQQLSQLEIGQPVRVALPASGLSFSGNITGIEPKIDPETRLIAVRAEVENSEGQLRPGQFVQLRVNLPAEEGVIAVAQTALTFSLYGDFVYVVREAEDTPAAQPSDAEPAQGEEAAEPTQQADAQTEGAIQDGASEAETTTQATEPAANGEAGKKLVTRQVFVKTGRRNEGMVEITDGLKPGDIVITAGQNRLSNGTPVTIDNTVNPATTEPPAGVAQNQAERQ